MFFNPPWKREQLIQTEIFFGKKRYKIKEMVKVVAVQGSSYKKQELFSATTRALVVRFFRANKQPPAYIHDSIVSARYTFTISGLYCMVLRGQPWAKSVDLLVEMYQSANQQWF